MPEVVWGMTPDGELEVLDGSTLESERFKRKIARTLLSSIEVEP